MIIFFGRLSSAICSFLELSQFSQFLPCHDIARTASFSRARKGIKKTTQEKQNQSSHLLPPSTSLLTLHSTLHPPLHPTLPPLLLDDLPLRLPLHLLQPRLRPHTRILRLHIIQSLHVSRNPLVRQAIRAIPTQVPRRMLG